MNHYTQIVKGILEGCILKIIEKGETYGYRILEGLNKYGFEVNEATVYSILTRLQSKGLLAIKKSPSPLGPVRKYYSLSAEGKDALKEFNAIWVRIQKITNYIMEGE